MLDVWLRTQAGMFPAREDAEDHDTAPCFVRLRDYRALLDRAEKAEAERDALRAAIFGGTNYATDLTNGNFTEMAHTTEAARLGALARAERVEAERDAAFAAGQEDMRERAAIVADLESRSCGPSYGGGYPAHTAMEITKGIRRLPIKTRP